MKKLLYTVKDDVAGSFDFFGVFPNDQLAIRSFKLATNADGIPVADLSLYRLASYDTDSGNIIESEFEFIVRGEKSEV